MRRTPLLAFAGTVIVLAAAGCGGGSGSGGSSASTSSGGSAGSGGSGGTPVKTIRIVEKEYSLTPSTISLPKRGLYVLQGLNRGTISHGLAIEGNGIDMDGRIVPPGKTSTIRVAITKNGSYEIYCPVAGHKQMGMEGHITLGTSGSGGPGGSGGSGTTTGSSGGYG